MVIQVRDSVFQRRFPMIFYPWNFITIVIFVNIYVYPTAIKEYTCVNLYVYWDPVCCKGIALILAWISNYIHYEEWEEITCPFEKFENG